jgi:hypothetical protein
MKKTAVKKTVAKKTAKKVATKTSPKDPRKEAVRAFYNFFKKYDQAELSTKVIPVDGVVINATYQICIYEDYMDIDWCSYDDETVSPTVRKFMDVMNMENWECWFDDNVDSSSLDEYSKEVDAICNEYRTLINALIKHGFSVEGVLDIFETVDNFETAYKQCSSNNVRTIYLNSSYSAEVREGFGYVKVGCQKIDIDSVRGILAAYDELNPQ